MAHVQWRGVGELHNPSQKKKQKTREAEGLTVRKRSQIRRIMNHPFLDVSA